MIPQIGRHLRRTLALVALVVAAVIAASAPSMAAAAPQPGKQLPAPQANAQPASTFRWIDYQTGRCLDSNANGDVYTLPCNGGSYQQWWIGPDFELCDYQTGRCIEALGQDIHAYFPSGDLSQSWYFRKGVSIPVYEVQNQQYTALCLDSNSSGNVYALGCNGGPYQAWFNA